MKQEEKNRLQIPAEQLLNIYHIPYIHLITFVKRRCVCGRWLNISIPQSKGAPDLIIFWRGKTYFVELKSKKGRLKPEQKEWKKIILSQNFPFLIFRDINLFKKWLDGLRDI